MRSNQSRLMLLSVSSALVLLPLTQRDHPGETVALTQRDHPDETVRPPGTRAGALPGDSIRPFRTGAGKHRPSVKTVEFTTDEGTWMSVDLSPNGKTIVFDLLGDLYTLPIEGGVATRILEGPAFEGQPRWSPDGKSIVFVSDRDGADGIWIVNADGSGARRFREGTHLAPAWSPDGQFIVATRRGKAPGGVADPGTVVLYPQDGGRAIEIGNGKGGAGFSPNGDLVYFAGADYSDWNSNIKIYQRSTGRISTLSAGRRPWATPDGRGLVFAAEFDGRAGLKYLDLETGRIRWLMVGTEWLNEADQGRDVVPGYAVSKDGKTIVASNGNKLWRIDIARGTRTPIPFKAAVKVEVAAASPIAGTVVADSGPVRVNRITTARISPDGRKLVFTALNRLWIQDLPSGTPRRLTNGTSHESWPSWSPDGRFIAFATWSASGGEIQRATPNGAVEKLTKSTGYFDRIGYSADGKRLLAIRGPRSFGPVSRPPGNVGPADLVWLPSSGGEPAVITPVDISGPSRWERAPATFVGQPFTTKDTSRVYLTDSKIGLVSMRWDGSDRAVVAKGPADDLILSPDGRYLATLGTGTGTITITAAPRGGGDRTEAVRPAGINESIPRHDADQVAWSADGRTLYYAGGSTLYRYSVASADSLALRKASDPASAETSLPEVTSQEVTVTVPRPGAKGTVVLRGGRLITMKGDEIIDRGDLVITDGRIVAVGRELAIPAGARVIDVTGKTVMPGYVEVDGGSTILDPDPSGQPWDDLTRLAYGVTTSRRAGKPSPATHDGAIRIEAGHAIGPRYLETASGIDGPRTPNETLLTAGWLRAGAPILRNDGPIIPLGNDLVQLVAGAGPIYLVGLGKSDGNEPSPRNRFIAEGRYHDDPKLRALVPHSVLDDELSGPEWQRDDWDRSARAAIDAAKIVAAGGRVALTTRGGFPGLALHWELWAANAQGRGLAPHEALRAVTMAAAQALGVSEALGSLEPGKIADLQVVDGDPLTDLRSTIKLAWVMKGGRLYDPTTLAERWPRETAAASLTWVDPDAPRTMHAPKPAPARPIPNDADRPLGGFTVTPLTSPRPRDPTYALPLTPTRTVRFTTDEGTRMGVDVSPDGKTVLFDMLGDLYTVPISGGRATRIMGGMAMDVQGSYSPDGKRIVFVSDRTGADNLWIADADGKNPRPVRRQALDTLADGPSDPTWTPDGRFVVTSGNLYDALTGGATRVAGLEGSHVAFGGSPRLGYVSRWGGMQIYDFGTGRVTPIITSLRNAYRLAVSRDNRWLAYLDRVDMETIIRVIDLEMGTNTSLVGASSDGEGPSLAIYDDFVFTPDSKALITTMGGKLWRIEVPSGRRTMIPFRADVEIDLGPLSQFQYPIRDSFTVRQIREPRLSPDGRRLAFIALDKLYLMDFPKGTPRRATEAVGVVENYPAWSPDGKFVAFTTSNDTAGGHVYRVEAAPVLDGRRPAAERLTAEPDLYGRLAYSLDGRRLVYGRSSFRELHATQYDYSRDMPVDFHWIDANGGPAHWITRETWNRLEPGAPPHFVADQPDRIFIPEYDALVSMRWDGSDRRTEARWTGGGYDGEGVIPAQGMLSPDGKKALVIYRNNLYLATLPPVPMDSLRLNPGLPDRGVAYRRLSRVGAEFIGWADRGKRAYFALGRSIFFYDVGKGEQALRDSLQSVDAARAAGRPNDRAGAGESLLERFDVSVVVPRAQANGIIALRNARLITMKGDEVIETGDLIIEDGRIIAIGKSGSVEVPKGVRVIDVKGKTILPGYVDLHDHMLARFITHNTQSPEYLSHLAYGVTTSRNPSSKTSDFLSYSDRVDAGDMLGPRILGVGPAYNWGRTKDSLTSLEDAQVLMRRYSEFYQTQTFKQYLSGNRLQRQWLVMATRDQGISPTTEGGHDWKMAITELIDGYAGHEHNYETFPLYRDAALLVAASGISYTLTLVVSYGGREGKSYYFSRENPHDDPKLRRFTWHDELDNRSRRASFLPEKEYVFPEVAASAGKIVRAGGNVGIGAHGELQGLGTHWELWMLGAGGLSNLEVLRAGTLTGARAVGLDRDIGSLEVGKLADLQILDANPLEDLRNTNTLRYVMKDGHLYDASTLDEVWPRPRQLGRQWWQIQDGRNRTDRTDRTDKNKTDRADGT